MDGFTVDPKTGRVPAPAQPITMTPEQEANAAAKVAKAREHRAARRAAGELAPPEPLATGTDAEITDADTAPEPLPWKTGDGPLDTTPAPEVSADEAARTTMLFGQEAYIAKHGMSRKLVERKAREAAELEASERNAAEAERAAPPLPTAEDVAKAKAAYEGAEALVAALRLELAGLPDKITDAVKTGQLARLPDLRQRQRALPDEIDAARVGAAQALIIDRQSTPPHAKAAYLAARRETAAMQEAFREWQAKVNASINVEADAQSTHREAILSLGAAMDALDVLIEELAQRHRPGQGYRALA